MANPQFTNAAEIPINEKPQCNFAQYKEIYLDTLDIFNTLRLILREFVEDAPADGKTYGRKDQSWVEVTGGGGGIPEAPVDGQLYGRKDAAWVIVPTIGSITWGSITGTLSSQIDLSNALNGKEPTITAGTTSQYWRGDKTWQTLNWTAIASKPTFAAVATSGAYSDLSGKPTIPAAQVNSDWNATTGLAQILNKPSIRLQLSADLSYYVRLDGADTNTGLVNSAAGAFRTVQKAIDVATTWDVNGKTITIFVGVGTFNESMTLKPYVGGGTILIRGINNDQTSTVFSTTTTNIRGVNTNYSHFRFTNFTLTNTGSSSYGILLEGGKNFVSYTELNFGAMGRSNIYVSDGSFLDARNAIYTVSGSVANGWHLEVADQGNAIIVAVTLTFSGTITFTSGGFARVYRQGYARIYSDTFVNSASVVGQKFYCDTGGGIFVNGAGISYLPGNAAGVTTTPGWYV